jgi:peptidoglycan/LPS O-acetylase OafA/YrhL
MYGLGRWAVGLFFIVSGLCIHLPMARRLAANDPSPLALKPYFLRRLLRIYPPHLIVLILSIAVAAALPLALSREARLISVPTWPQLVAHLFLVHTFSGPAFESANQVLWTIAVETQFYLLYPLVLLARRRWTFAQMTGALFVLSLLLGAIALKIAPDQAWLVQDTFAARLWEWVLGCWIAERLVLRGEPLPVSRLALAAALLGTLAVGYIALHYSAGAIVLRWVWPPLLAIPVLLGARLATSARSPIDRALSAIGHRSYSLYLTHAIAITGLAALLLHTRLPALAQALLELLASALFCAVFFHWIERPFLRAASSVQAGPAVATSR